MRNRDCSLLFRLLVVPFFRENGAMIAVVYFICFGFFEGIPNAIEVHRSMMHDICSLGWALGASCLLWGVYYLKSVSFVLRELREHKNECLYVLGLGNGLSVFASLLFVFAVISLPISLYGFFTTLVGIQSGLLAASAAVVSVHLLFLLGGAFLCVSLLRNAHVRIQLPFPILWSVRISLPYYLYFGRDLLLNRKVLLLMNKLISLSVLWVGGYLMKTQGLDLRFGLMCMIAAATSHAVLLQKLREVEDETMEWLGNLPVVPFARFCGYLAFFALLLFPEMIFLVKFVPGLLQWQDLLVFLGLGVAALSLVHSLLFKTGMNSDKFTNQAFASWLLMTFSIQFKLPPYAVLLFSLGLSLWYYKRRYYLYEKAA